jgi:hypothetical protein
MIMTANDFFDNLFTGEYPLANILSILLIVIFFVFLFRKAILVEIMKKLDIPTKTELKGNEFFHLQRVF